MRRQFYRISFWLIVSLTVDPHLGHDSERDINRLIVAGPRGTEEPEVGEFVKEVVLTKTNVVESLANCREKLKTYPALAHAAFRSSEASIGADIG
jgi:hypothetical protein